MRWSSTTFQLWANWKLPSHLRLQLKLFAGQVDFTSFDDYKQTCEILSLALEPPKEGSIVAGDGFAAKGMKHTDNKFMSSPDKYLKLLWRQFAGTVRTLAERTGEGCSLEKS